MRPDSLPKANAAGFRVYCWEGQPIGDPIEWARKNGHQMVVVRYVRRDPNPFGNHMTVFEEIEDVPAPFFDNLLMSGFEAYDLGRYEP